MCEYVGARSGICANMCGNDCAHCLVLCLNYALVCMPYDFRMLCLFCMYDGVHTLLFILLCDDGCITFSLLGLVSS